MDNKWLDAYILSVMARMQNHGTSAQALVQQPYDMWRQTANLIFLYMEEKTKDCHKSKP